MDKEDVYIYIQQNTILPLKKNEILPLVTIWIDLEGIMLSEISQRKTHTLLSQNNVTMKNFERRCANYMCICTYTSYIYIS